MKFLAIVLLLVGGVFLVVGGTLMGSDALRDAGRVCWGGAALLILWAAWRYAADAIHDWRLKKYMRELRKGKANPRPRYSPGAGLR